MVLSQIVLLWLLGLLAYCPCFSSTGLGPPHDETKVNATRILFVTTVDPRYNGPIFGTWMMWFLHSVVAEVDTSRYSLHLSVGCMPLKQRDSQRLHVDSYAMQLLAGLLPCSYLHDIPGFKKDNNDTRFKFSVTYPNVRRMLMLQGLAETRQWDVIVYADVDAFFVRNPLPELLRLYETGRYAAAFQRDEYNSSERICNGLWAMFDMRLPRHIAEHGGYGQAQINDWIRGRMIDKFVSKPTVYRTELSFISQSVVSKEEYRWRLYLLPEPQFYRGTCGSVPPSSGPMFVNHCHSTYFRAYEKELELRKDALLLPFRSISNMVAPNGIPGNTSVNDTQVLHEFAVLLHAMNQSIATLREHAGAFMDTHPIVAAPTQGRTGIDFGQSSNGSQVSRYLRGSPVPFQSVQATPPRIVPQGPSVNQGKTVVGRIAVTRNPSLPRPLRSGGNGPPSEGASRFAQQDMQTLHHALSRPARSQTSRHAATGKGTTTTGNTPQTRTSATSQGSNYVPSPLSLPPSLHQVLAEVFPSDETHRHRLPKKVDGYFMRDLSVVANKDYGQVYHVSVVVSGGPTTQFVS